MAFEHAAGRDLSTNDSTTGKPGAITGVGAKEDAVTTRTVIVRGPLSALENNVPKQGADHTGCGWVPDGFLVDTATLTSSDGEGTITLQCVRPGVDGSGTPISPTLITYQIDMVECQMDLITHPTITTNANALDECIKWLATDEAKRFDGTDYYWEDPDGVLQPVNQAEAINFCAAWLHGIHTYNRYYPVINKESTYTRIPGLTMGSLTNKFSISGGTAAFSADTGKFSTPDISLTGFAATGFFKSGDGYRTSGKKTWTRTEQWTWTPDGNGSPYAWIYGGQTTSGGGQA